MSRRDWGIRELLGDWGAEIPLDSRPFSIMALKSSRIDYFPELSRATFGYVLGSRSRMLVATSLEFVLRQRNQRTENTISSMAKRNGTPVYSCSSNDRITNGLWCDYITAAVRTGNANSQASGISVLVIALTAAGVTRRKLKNSGLAASGSTFIEFDNVSVPISNLLGKENQGF